MGGVNINDAEYNLTLSCNRNNNNYIILNTRILCAKCTRMINEHNSS